MQKILFNHWFWITFLLDSGLFWVLVNSKPTEKGTGKLRSTRYMGSQNFQNNQPTILLGDKYGYNDQDWVKDDARNWVGQNYGENIEINFSDNIGDNPSEDLVKKKSFSILKKRGLDNSRGSIKTKDSSAGNVGREITNKGLRDRDGKSLVDSPILIQVKQDDLAIIITHKHSGVDEPNLQAPRNISSPIHQWFHTSPVPVTRRSSPAHQFSDISSLPRGEVVHNETNIKIAERNVKIHLSDSFVPSSESSLTLDQNPSHGVDTDTRVDRDHSEDTYLQRDDSLDIMQCRGEACTANIRSNKGLITDLKSFASVGLSSNTAHNNNSNLDEIVLNNHNNKNPIRNSEDDFDDKYKTESDNNGIYDETITNYEVDFDDINNINRSNINRNSLPNNNTNNQSNNTNTSNNSIITTNIHTAILETVHARVEVDTNRSVEEGRTSEIRELGQGRRSSFGADVGRSLDLGDEEQVYVVNNDANHVDDDVKNFAVNDEVRLEAAGDLNRQIERRSSRNRFLDVSNMVVLALGLLVFILILSGVAGGLLYRRQYTEKRQGERFSNFDSSSFADSDTFNTISYADCAGIEIEKETSSEELYSLDNDSFLASLEAITFQDFGD